MDKGMLEKIHLTWCVAGGIWLVVFCACLMKSPYRIDKVPLSVEIWGWLILAAGAGVALATIWTANGHTKR